MANQVLVMKHPTIKGVSGSVQIEKEPTLLAFFLKIVVFLKNHSLTYLKLFFCCSLSKAKVPCFCSFFVV